MKLEKWALVAEIASGIAVLVTLVVLVIGVRDNTNVTRAAVYENLMSDLNQFNLAMVNDPELSLLWAGDRSTADKDAEAASRLVLLNRVIYRIYESAYFSFENGSLGLAQWQRFGATICQTRRRADAELWSGTASVLTDEFLSYIEESCAE